MARYGARFPLLAKLIDAAEWLSLQVHPDDALARELFGPDAVGKAEAWVVLDAAAGAELIVGAAEGLAEAELRDAIAGGTAGRDHCRVRPAVAGDVLLIRPGTLHAIGGGTFLYELQQPSDLTFRVSDWGRAGRELHVEPSLRALVADAVAESRGRGFRLDDARAGGDGAPPRAAVDRGARRAPAGGSIGRGGHGASGLARRARRRAGRSRSPPLETLVVPAAVDAWRLEGPEDGLAAIGTVP